MTDETEAAEARVAALTAQLAEARESERAAVVASIALYDVARQEAEENLSDPTDQGIFAQGFLHGVQMQRAGGLPNE